MAQAAEFVRKFTVQGVGPRREFVVTDEALALALLVALERSTRHDPPTAREVTPEDDPRPFRWVAEVTLPSGATGTLTKGSGGPVDAYRQFGDLRLAGIRVDRATLYDRRGGVVDTYTDAAGWQATP